MSLNIIKVRWFIFEGCSEAGRFAWYLPVFYPLSWKWSVVMIVGLWSVFSHQFMLHLSGVITTLDPRGSCLPLKPYSCVTQGAAVKLSPDRDGSWLARSISVGNEAQREERERCFLSVLQCTRVFTSFTVLSGKDRPRFSLTNLFMLTGSCVVPPEAQAGTGAPPDRQWNHGCGIHWRGNGTRLSLLLCVAIKQPVRARWQTGAL